MACSCYPFRCPDSHRLNRKQKSGKLCKLAIRLNGMKIQIPAWELSISPKKRSRGMKNFPSGKKVEKVSPEISSNNTVAWAHSLTSCWWSSCRSRPGCSSCLISCCCLLSRRTRNSRLSERSTRWWANPAKTSERRRRRIFSETFSSENCFSHFSLPSPRLLCSLNDDVNSSKLTNVN